MTVKNLEQLSETLGSVSINKNGEVRPGCLGKLSGIIADFKNPTRNGRLYPKELWVNVFEKTPWVKEALKTKTLFGEADHPEDRLQSTIVNAAVVLTDYSIDDDAGVVKGSFDILDTPSGKILKTLAEYGSTLGVSTRGEGSVYEDNGEDVVDPDSYVFGGVDVVVLPAVKDARQAYINESKNTKNSKRDITKILLAEVENSSSEEQLSTLKSMIESANLDPKSTSELSSTIESKLLDLSSNTIAGNTSDLEEAYKEIKSLKKKLSSYKTNTISLSKYKKLSDMFTESNHSLKVANLQLDEVANESSSKHNQLSKTLDNLKEELDRQSHLVKLSEAKHEELSTKLKEEVNEHRVDNIRYKSRLRRSNKKLTNYNESISDYDSKINSLTRANLKLSHQLHRSSRLSEAKVQELEDKLSSLKESSDKLYRMNDKLINELDESYKKSDKLVRDSNLRESNSNRMALVSTPQEVTENVHPKERNQVNTDSALLEGYIDSQLRLNGLSLRENKESFKSAKTKSEVDSTISILAESKARLNSLPVNLNNEAPTARRGFINEDISRKPGSTASDNELEHLDAISTLTKSMNFRA